LLNLDEPPILPSRRSSSKEIDQPPSLPSRHQTIHTDDLALQQQVSNITDTSDSTHALSNSPLPQGWEHAYGTILFIQNQNID
jgi:hypothetical protein